MSNKATRVSKNEEQQALVPRLRFPEFTEKWRPAEIGEVFISDEELEKATHFDNEKILTVKLHSNGVVRNERTGTLTGGANYFKRRAGQFIFSKIDLLNGAFGIVPEELDGFFSSSDVPAFSFGIDHSPAFFLNWLTANYQRLVIERTGTSATLKRVSPEKFRALPISLPSPAEQKKIADCLGSVDDLIAAEVRKLTALRDHKNGLMQQLFPREGETRPSIRFPEFRNAADWRTRKISCILTKKAEPATLDDNGVYREIGVRSHGKGLFHKEPITGKVIGAKRVFHVVPDALVINIVFAWEQAIAVTTKIEVGFIASHRFPMFVPKANRCNVAFMQRLFLTPVGKHLLQVASPGGAGRNRTLNQKEFERLEVVIPSTDEQERIADCLATLDAMITAQAEKIDALRTHKRYLMQQLFPSPEDAET